jgi:hypothetical protein
VERLGWGTMKTVDLRKARCIIVPSISASMLKDWSTVTMSVHLHKFEDMVEELRMCKEVINYVRHRPTTDIIAKHVGRSDIRTEFEYIVDPSDVIYVVGLKSRTPVSGADVAVEPEDLLIYRAWIDVVAPTVEKALREGWIEM